MSIAFHSVRTKANFTICTVALKIQSHLTEKLLIFVVTCNRRSKVYALD